MLQNEYLVSCQFLDLHLRLVKPLQEALRPLGITVKNFAVMQLIDENPNISQNGLAEIMQKDKTLIVQIIDKLEGKGLAKRDSVKNDRRVYALSLTMEGKRIVDAHKNILLESESVFLASLPEEDQAALRRILRQLMR